MIKFNNWYDKLSPDLKRDLEEYYNIDKYWFILMVPPRILDELDDKCDLTIQRLYYDGKSSYWKFLVTITKSIFNCANSQPDLLWAGFAALYPSSEFLNNNTGQFEE